MCRAADSWQQRLTVAKGASYAVCAIEYRAFGRHHSGSPSAAHLRIELSSYRDCSRRRERVGRGGTRWSRIWTARGGRDAALRDGRSVVVEVAMNAAMAIAEIKRRRP